MYKAVSQTVLLHDIKKKVVMGSMLTQITVMTADHVAYGKWEYPPLVADLEAVGLYPIQEYIQRQYATMAAQVAFQPIYDLCTNEEQRPGTIQMMKWWDQDAVQESEE